VFSFVTKARQCLGRGCNQKASMGPLKRLLANRDRVVAGVTAILHNRGGSAQHHFNNLAATLADNYVGRVLAIWDNL
jgi:hypothetical protein